MTIITKAALAAEMKVTKSRVSQYVRAGLPVRADGKIDREAALNWVGLNCRSAAMEHDKGPALARKIAEVPAHVVGDAEAARRALRSFAGRVGFYVAGTAVDLGLPMATVYALVTELSAGLDDVAWDAMLRYCGGEKDRRLVSGSKALAPDWTDLAGRAGEPVDLTAWQAHHAEVHAKLYPPLDLDRILGEPGSAEPEDAAEQ